MHPRNQAHFRKYENKSRVPSSSTDRVLRFASLDEKARWLDGAASLDALRGQVQDHARRFLQIADPEARTRAIQRWVRDSIKYQYDFRVSLGLPGEEFADTSTSLTRGYGDCDDKARAFVALVRATEMMIGEQARRRGERPPRPVQVRIRPVFTKGPNPAFVHVQAEVRWPRSELQENAMQGGWLLAELIVKGCEIGQNPDTVPRLANGDRAIV